MKFQVKFSMTLEVDAEDDNDAWNKGLDRMKDCLPIDNLRAFDIEVS